MPASDSPTQPPAKVLTVTALVIAIATVLAYWPVWDHEFIAFDDNKYVYENTAIRDGLTGDAIAWAFTTGHCANWHPITWISHMIDVELYGLEPGGHHVSGLLFHVANTLLVLLLLVRTTGHFWASAVVAALFGLHPTHVESVAWVSERKDVLSTMFWLLTMLLYARWVQRPSRGRYIATTACLALGLMAKPMLVTLPFVLVLFDYWPLRRLELEPRSFKQRIVEKAPWFALSAVSSVVTFLVQQAGGAVRTLETIPVTERLANTVVAYVSYIGVTFWPQDLALFYPHPEGGSQWWLVLVATVVFAGLFVVAWRMRSRCRAIGVGWFWFVGTLVPVIGLVQVGGQSMADRYTYVPHIGLFTMIVFGVVQLTRVPNRVLVGAGAAISIALAIVTNFQVAKWKDSFTLFHHTLSVTEENAPIHYNLGTTYGEEGDYEKARHHLEEAVRIKPKQIKQRINLGHIYMLQKDVDEAETYYLSALEIDPLSVGANFAMARVMIERRDAVEAERYLRVVVNRDPTHIEAQFNLGAMLAQQQKFSQARKHLREAIKLSGGQHEQAQTILSRIPNR